MYILTKLVFKPKISNGNLKVYRELNVYKGKRKFNYTKKYATLKTLDC